MNRRQLIGTGTAVVGLGLMPGALSQPTAPSVRAAVVVGVDAIGGGLPTLSASKDATRVADWLTGQGFDVTKLTDEAGATVEADDVFKAVRAYVDAARFEVLVIYFAGHGFASGFSEWWMLSGAPDDPAQAISFDESEILARQCGIPNVVIVSDACRSLPTTTQFSRMSPRNMFPNPRDQSITTQVDTLKAATFGMTASEVPLIDEIARRGGIFTATLMDAFRSPWPDMTATLQGGEVVVRNNKLKRYLEAETNRRIQEIQGITKSQVPEISAWSDIYISRVLQTTRSQPDEAAKVSTSPQTVAAFQLNKLGVSLTETQIFTASVGEHIENSETFARFETLQTQIAEAKPSDQTETRTGLSVSGVGVERIVAHSSVNTSIIGPNAPVFSVWADIGELNRVADCLIQFADGNLAVLPIVRDFVTNVFYGEQGVESVTFVPATEGSRWFEYQESKERIDALHASVAAASAIGGFQFQGDPGTRNASASQLADQIRLAKSLDPTLGIYAAYAYAQAGLPEKVRSVAEFMRGDLGFDFLDLALLATGTREGSFDLLRRASPIWPMLTQGWDYLQAYGSPIDPAILSLRPHLQRSLWTTMSREATEIAIRIVIERPPR